MLFVQNNDGAWVMVFKDASESSSETHVPVKQAECIMYHAKSKMSAIKLLRTVYPQLGLFDAMQIGKMFDAMKSVENIT